MILKRRSAEKRWEMKTQENISKTKFLRHRLDLLITVVSNSSVHFHFGSCTFGSNGWTSKKLGQTCVPFGHPWGV